MRTQMESATDQKKISLFYLGRSAVQFLENGILMAFLLIQAVAIFLAIAPTIVKIFETIMSIWP